MKNELDKILKTTYHNGNVPTDYLNQTVLRNVREYEHTGQSINNDKKMRTGHGSSMKKFARVAAIILFLGCAGYIGASATGYAKPISEIFRSVFHIDEDTAEFLDSMGHLVGKSQIQDGVKITESAVLGDGSTYAIVFDIEKEDGTAFDFAKDIFDENGNFKVGSDGAADKWVRFKSLDAEAPTNAYSSSAYFYDADPTDSSIQMVTIYSHFEGARDGRTLTQSFTDFELYDVEKDDTSVIAKGTWEFTCSLNCGDLSKTAFENQDATIGLLSATNGSCVISPLQYNMEFTIKNADFFTYYKEINADGLDIGTFNLDCDLRKQGIYLNMKNGEKMDVTHEMEVGHSFNEEDALGTISIKKRFDRIVSVEQIESISIGDQTFEMKNK